MKVVAFIFARGGSKGLPGKNIKKFAGKSLIARAIEHAQSIPCVQRVIVSTDCNEIAKNALDSGAEVPFIRPDYLAQDDSPEWLAWQHAIKYLIHQEKYDFDVMVSVPVTAPLRKPSDISKCLDEYEEKKPDAVITVTDAHRNPYFNMVTSNSGGFMKLLIEAEENITRRQDAPEVFDMTTVCYVANTRFVLENRGIFAGKVSYVKIPIERSIDIDTELDFKIAEFLYSQSLKWEE